MLPFVPMQNEKTKIWNKYETWLTNDETTIKTRWKLDEHNDEQHYDRNIMNMVNFRCSQSSFHLSSSQGAPFLSNPILRNVSFVLWLCCHLTLARSTCKLKLQAFSSFNCCCTMHSHLNSGVHSGVLWPKKHNQWKILHICSYHWCSLKIILSHHACRALAIIVTALGKKDKDRFGQKENFLPNGRVDGGLKSQKKHLTPSQIFSARRFGCPTSLNSYISNAHAMMQ